MWTYEILNYSGHADSGDVVADLLIIDGRVVGGDICSTVRNGFMHGFEAPDPSAEAETMAGTDSETAAASRSGAGNKITILKQSARCVPVHLAFLP